jgi:hypothetical protein
VTRTHLRVLSTLLASHAAESPDERLPDVSAQDAVHLLGWSTSAAALAAAALAETDPQQAVRYRNQVRDTLAEAHALAWCPGSNTV